MTPRPASGPHQALASQAKSARTDMNILALLTDAYGGYGGIAQYNRDMVDALADRDDVRSIDVAVRVAPLPVPKLNEKVRQAPPVYSRLRYALSCARISLVRRPKLIFNGHLYHGPLGVQLAKLTGAKLISQLHGTEIWGDVARRHLAPLSRSDLVLCVSQDTRQRLLSLAPDLEARARVLPNMVRPHFRPGDREAARRRFGLADEKVVLTVARLDGRNGYKGHDRIIRFLPALRAKHGSAVRYFIAGEGDDRARLERLAREAGVSDLTVFLGRVPTEALPDLYRAADLFAMPSTGEGFGIVYLEAMACGTPALGVDVGGVADVFADIEPGWCVSPEDFELALIKSLAAERPDPRHLSDRVHRSFGQSAFRDRLGKALHLWDKQYARQ